MKTITYFLFIPILCSCIDTSAEDSNQLASAGDGPAMALEACPEEWSQGAIVPGLIYYTNMGSMDVAPDGRVHVLYEHDNVAYHAWSEVDFSQWLWTELDPQLSASKPYSAAGAIAVDSAGVHIASYDRRVYRNDAKYAYRSHDRTRWDISTLASEGDIGRYASIDISESGTIHISYLLNESYYDPNPDELHALHRSPGGQWVTQTADLGNVEWLSEMALDRAGGLHWAYYVDGAAPGVGDSLMYVRYTADGIWTKSLVQTDVARSRKDLSIALDSSGQPQIFYVTLDGIELAQQTSAGDWTSELAIPTPSSTIYTFALTTDPDGGAHIAYYNGKGGVYYAYRSAHCTDWQVQEVLAEGNEDSPTFGQIDVAVDPNRGLVHIAYEDLVSQLWHAYRCMP